MYTAVPRFLNLLALSNHENDSKPSEVGHEDWMMIRFLRMMDDDDDDKVVGRQQEQGSVCWSSHVEYDAKIRRLGLVRLSKGPGDGSNV